MKPLINPCEHKLITKRFTSMDRHRCILCGFTVQENIKPVVGKGASSESKKRKG